GSGVAIQIYQYLNTQCPHPLRQCQRRQVGNLVKPVGSSHESAPRCTFRFITGREQVHLDGRGPQLLEQRRCKDGGWMETETVRDETNAQYSIRRSHGGTQGQGFTLGHVLELHGLAACTGEFMRSACSLG